jgi:hypothetical protein
VRAICKAAAGVGYRVQQLILLGVLPGLMVVPHIFVIGAIYLTWQCGTRPEPFAPQQASVFA